MNTNPDKFENVYEIYEVSIILRDLLRYNEITRYTKGDRQWSELLIIEGLSAQDINTIDILIELSELISPDY